MHLRYIRPRPVLSSRASEEVTQVVVFLYPTGKTYGRLLNARIQQPVIHGPFLFRIFSVPDLKIFH